MKAKKKNEDRKGEKCNKDYEGGKKKGDGKQKQWKENPKEHRQNLKGKAQTFKLEPKQNFCKHPNLVQCQP